MNTRMPSPKALLRAMLCAALLPVFSVALGQPLFSQTTYTSYDFTTMPATAGISGGLAVDGNGNLYVVDGSTIRKITADGVVTTLAGTEGIHGSADGTGPAAQFNDAAAIAVDGSGNVYVADTMNMTIRKVTPAGVVTTLAGTAGGSPAFSDGKGSAARFWGPESVAVDAAGNVYVADYGYIRRITPDGTVTTLPNPGGFLAVSVAVDGNGNVFIASSSTIVEMAVDGTFRTLAGNALGSADGTGSAAQFWWPGAVAVDGNGNVIVADTWNDTIRRVTAGGVVTTVAGIPGAAGNADGAGPAARFNRPAGLAVDSVGNVYVSDASSPPSNGIQVGHFVPQAQATVTLGNLYQVYDGTAKSVSTATNPAGLATLVIFSPGGFAAPTDAGSYSVWAMVVDPNYTGSAYGTLTIRPGRSAQSFVIRNSRAGGSTLEGIAAGSAGLVAVGDGGTILTSTDGSTWTHRASGTTSSLFGVAYGAGQYVAVGDVGCVLLSADGVAWSSVAQSATTARLDNVVYAAGQYVAVGEGGTIINSKDGRLWTARGASAFGPLRGLTYTNELNEGTFGTSMGPIPAIIPARFVAAGLSGQIIVSTDGNSWGADTPYGLDAGEDVEALVADKTSHFIALGVDGSLFTNTLMGGGSLDFSYEDLGDQSPPAAGSYSCLVQGAGALFVAGENGTVLTETGVGGQWFQATTGTTVNLVSGVAIGDSVFIVGENEIILQLAQPTDSRLTNLSCRAQVGTGANILITGFVVGGQGAPGSERLLIRASGPALVPFGVSGVLPDPELQLVSTAPGTDLQFAPNTGWAGNGAVSGVAYLVGAFPWTDFSSHDAAFVWDLAPGPYTANISGESGGTGVALAEVYDATPEGTATAASPRLINLSARAQIGTGSTSLIAGFVIGGTTPKTVLIRASGPALVPFGVSGTLPDPQLQVYSTASGSNLVASNTGWGGDGQIATAAAWVGAFSWGSSATPDSALLLTLAPGPYTANVTGASGDTGMALVEIYEVQ